MVLCVELKQNIFVTLLRVVDKKGTTHPLVPEIERQNGLRCAKEIEERKLDLVKSSLKYCCHTSCLSSCTKAPWKSVSITNLEYAVQDREKMKQWPQKASCFFRKEGQVPLTYSAINSLLKDGFHFPSAKGIDKVIMTSCSTIRTLLWLNGMTNWALCGQV